MKNDLIYKYGIDNIFDFSFMEDFTTVILAKEEYEIDISKLDFKNEDNFYSFSENRAYTENELFKKFNIKRVF
ncbi:MAG: hypothetical protein AB7E37_08400 [Candidatus Altimarinota bacterium]